MKTIRTVFLLTIIFLFGLQTSVSAYEPAATYTYDVHANPLALREAYTPRKTLDGEQLGIGAFKDISALTVKDDKLYICDSGNNRVVVLNSDLQCEEIINEFTNRSGEKDSLLYPTDISVGSNGDRYVVDYQNFRIVAISPEGEHTLTIDKVQSDMLGSNYRFTPSKLALDSYDNLYVVAKGVNYGIMDMDLQGNVMSFLGAAKVSFDPSLYLKKMFLSDEQVNQLTKIIPTEYNNLHMDKQNFLYGTINVVDPEKIKAHIKGSLYMVDSQAIGSLNQSLVDKVLGMLSPSIGQSGQNDVFKKLNMKGEDILTRGGYHPVVGDLDFETDVMAQGVKTGASSFVDMVVHENGAYSILDQNRNKIFTYDAYGVLLYAFGGTGKNAGQFDKVSSIEKMGDDLIVADSVKNTVTFFQPTEFAQTIDRAMEAYSGGRYEDALAYWQKSIAQCSNFEVGYIGAGRSLLRLQRYGEAMDYFKLGEYREGYDQAFEFYRQEWLRGPGGSVLLGAIAFVLIAMVFLRWLYKKRSL